MTVTEKTCTKCGETKPAGEFHRDKLRADGRFPQCKDCRRTYTSIYRDRQRERDRARRATATPRPCEIEGCVKDVIEGRFCAMHRARINRHGSPDVVKKAKVNWGPANPGWNGNSCTYSSAHQRTARRRGAASVHWCAACRGRAAQWAYDHADPGELFEVRNGHLTPFSPHAEHYTPMCVPCHKAFDAFALGQAARVGMFDEWLAEQAIERGERGIRLDEAVAIAAALHVTVESLTRDEAS